MVRHGGKRTGAGRKSDKQLDECRALIDSAVTKAQWKAIFRRMVKLATSDKANERAAVAAAELLLRYRFGLPTQIIAGAPDMPPIQFVDVKRG